MGKNNELFFEEKKDKIISQCDSLYVSRCKVTRTEEKLYCRPNLCKHKTVYTFTEHSKMALKICFIQDPGVNNAFLSFFFFWRDHRK